MARAMQDGPLLMHADDAYTETLSVYRSGFTTRWCKPH